MSLLNESIQDKKFDVRMIDKNLFRNVIADKDLKTHLEKLQDDSENAQYVSIEELDQPKA